MDGSLYTDQEKGEGRGREKRGGAGREERGKEGAGRGEMFCQFSLHAHLKYDVVTHSSSLPSKV